MAYNNVGRPISLPRVNITKLYQNPRPVTEAKKKDMLDLLQFIPPIHHQFYNNLQVSNTITEYIGPLEVVYIEEDEEEEEED